MKRLTNLMLAALICLFALYSCKSDVDLTGGPEVIPDGEATVKLDFQFEGLNIADTRGVQGGLDFGLNNLVILFYEASTPEDDADPEDIEPIYTFEFNKGEFFCEKESPRNPAHCEDATYHGLVTLEKVEYGAYRVYAVANVSDKLGTKDAAGKYTITEKDLREIQIQWPSYTEGDAMCSVPDAMFGYFTTEGVNDHVDEKYRNVIHHNITKGIYPGNGEETKNGTSLSLDHDISHPNRAKVVVLNKRNLDMQAWLKRVVSKLTIGFDGSGLRRGVEVYIKSVRIADAASTCFLGHDNSVGDKNDLDKQVRFLQSTTNTADNSDYSSDPRLYTVYSAEEGAKGIEISRDKPAFPRENFDENLMPDSNYDDNKATNDLNGDGWHDKWYEYIHGSTTNTNPTYNNNPTTLYFFENLQGVAEGTPKLMTHESVDHFGSAGHAEEATEDCTYYKDGKKDGTYIEVKAYYHSKNPYSGKVSEGDITYRFMLGKNVTNDFNAERNCHYKLILSFLGDANDIDWHIDYEEVIKPYFRIPYDQDYDLNDKGFTDNANNEKWNNSENWKQSSVWYAYDDNDEPMAEIAKEIVYWSSEDPNYEKAMTTPIIEAGVPRTYYQIVTVYPVVKNGSDFTTDYSKGIIAQVLACDSQSETNLPKANGKVHMLKRTEPNTTHTTGRQWRGYYVIKSLNWGTDGDEQVYNYVYPSETRNENGYYDLTLGLSPKTKRLTTGAYRIKDVDNNSYPIVKIGTSYWMRESLKTTHYSNNTSAPIDAWDSSKTYTKGGPEDGPNEPGWVYFDERWPLYKDLGNVRLYNFFALTGTKAKDDNYGEGRTYDYCSEDYEVAGDPMFEFMEGGVFALLQPEYQLLDYEYESEPNLQITPKGWHIPITYAAGGNGFYGEHWDDNLYIEEFIGNNWGRALKNSTKWPSIDYQINKFNLSDLCIDPIPSTWESNENTITFDVDIVSGLNKSNNLDGVVVPFWGHLMQTETTGKEKQILWWYANPTFLTIDAENYNGTLVSKQSYGDEGEIVNYCKLVNKCYLPVRGVRHAYDYKVPKKEGDEEHYIVIPNN